MLTPPTGYVSLCEVAKRAAEALHAPAGGTLNLTAQVLWLSGIGEGWSAVLMDLQADTAHVPHTLRAFAWRAGQPEMPEIPAAFWRGHYTRELRRIDHASWAGQGWRVEGVPAPTPDMRAHFMFEGEWALPLVLESDADAFMQRIAGAPAAQEDKEHAAEIAATPLPGDGEGGEETDSPDDASVVAPVAPPRGRPNKGTPKILEEYRRRAAAGEALGNTNAEARHLLVWWRGLSPATTVTPVRKTIAAGISKLRAAARKSA